MVTVDRLLFYAYLVCVQLASCKTVVKLLAKIYTLMDEPAGFIRKLALTRVDLNNPQLYVLVPQGVISNTPCV